MIEIVIYNAPGRTGLYLFPDSKSLADWLTYRVLLVEGTGANAGRYTASIDPAHGLRWVVFYSASQPSDWNQIIQTLGWGTEIPELLTAIKADPQLGTGAGGAANADEVKARVRAGVGGVWEDEDGNRTTLGVTDPV